jgi:hypothetical protein
MAIALEGRSTMNARHISIFVLGHHIDTLSFNKIGVFLAVGRIFDAEIRA